MSAQGHWDGILDPGEEILWQGRPDGAVVFRPSSIFTFVSGLCFSGFALFWMVTASQEGGTFWMVGLLHFCVGLGISFGAIFWSAWKRRHSWYTLTNRRAFIASDLPFRGRSLKSYPVSDDTVLELEPGDLTTVWFAEATSRSGGGYLTTIKIGFERIPDGTEVYRLMRDVQQGAQ